jgi:hypothetical protein
MSTTDWKVDDAVNEVMAGIHDGSALTFLKPPDDLALKNTYHDLFEKTQGKIDWTIARKRVLPLAYMVGALATMLAAVDQALTKTHSKPERVLPQHARRAAYLISKVCTYSGPQKFGAMCDPMPLPEGCGTAEDNDKIAGPLREIFKVLQLVQA